MIELLGQYSAQIIALCALVFTAYHAAQQRKHNRLSVRPHLTSFVQSDRDEKQSHIRMELQNNGLGPAYIKEFQIYLDKEPSTFSHALNTVTENIPCKLGHVNLAKGYALPSGDIKHIVHVTFSNDIGATFEEIYDSFNRIDLAVKYECAYGKLHEFDTFD